MYSSRPKVYWIDGSCLRAKWNDDDRSRGRLANRKSACKKEREREGEGQYFYISFGLSFLQPAISERTPLLFYCRGPKLYSVCSSPGALARLRFFRLLFYGSFPWRLRCTGPKLKMDARECAAISGIGDFSLFFFVPLLFFFAALARLTSLHLVSSYRNLFSQITFPRRRFPAAS